MSNPDNKTSNKSDAFSKLNALPPDEREKVIEGAAKTLARIARKQWREKVSREIRQFKVNFEMTPYGDVDMHITVGDQTVTIFLSSAVFCFEHFIGWLTEIERGAAVPRYSIDEEGPDKEIHISEVAIPDIVRIRILGLHEEQKVFLDGYINQKQFISAYKEALKSFFSVGYVEEEEVDPEALKNALVEYFGEEQYKEMYGNSDDKLVDEPRQKISLKERVLSNPWLHSP